MEKLFAIYMLISICIALFVLPKIFQLLNSDIKVDKNTKKKFDSLDNRIDTIERVINDMSRKISKTNQSKQNTKNVSELVVIMDILKLSQEKMSELYDNHLGFMTFAEYISSLSRIANDIKTVSEDGIDKNNSYVWNADIQIIEKLSDGTYALTPATLDFKYIDPDRVSYTAITQVWMPDYIQALAIHKEYVPKQIEDVYKTGIELIECAKVWYRSSQENTYRKYSIIGGCFFPRVVHADVDAMKESISDTNYNCSAKGADFDVYMRLENTIPAINTEGESGTCQTEN